MRNEIIQSKQGPSNIFGLLYKTVWKHIHGGKHNCDLQGQTHKIDIIKYIQQYKLLLWCIEMLTYVVILIARKKPKMMFGQL